MTDLFEGAENSAADDNQDTNNDANVSDDFIYPDGFDETLKGHTAFDNFKDHEKKSFNYANIMKSFAHQAKLIGADKVVVPNENYTDEDWTAFYDKMGRGTKEDYIANVKNTLPEGDRDDETFSAFLETAYEAGVLPAQAQKVVDFLNTSATKQGEQHQEMTKAELEKQTTQLKEEWGDAYDKNLKMAQQAAMNFTTEDERKYMQDKGYSDDLTLLKIFQKVGKGLQEDDQFNDDAKADMGLSKDDVQQKINALYNDNSFMNKDHEYHEVAVDKMLKYQAMLHGNDPVIGG